MAPAQDDGDRVGRAAERARSGAPEHGREGAGPAGSGDRPRLVEVAVDTPGAAGTGTFTYMVPPALHDLVAGEAVIVGFGRRQALGIVLGEGAAPDAVRLREVVARVRSEGPLLPPLTLALVRDVARHYLAPIALVLRASLPPGLLERLELRAIARPDRPPVGGADPAPAVTRDAELLAAIAAAGSLGAPLRGLPPAGSRATLLRRLHELEGRGLIDLEWRLGDAAGAPRLERRAALTDAGMAAAAAISAGDRIPGRRLGPRQEALLLELAATIGRAPVTADESSIAEPGAGIEASGLSARHGASALVGLAARGLVRVWTAERPRRPLAGRDPATRGSRPPGSELDAAQAAPLAAIAEAIARRSTPVILLDGVTAGGKTAVYAGAIGAAIAAGRGALVLVPEIPLAVPLVDRLRADLGAEVALLHGGLSEGERADEWRRIRAGDVRVVVGTRSAVLAPLADPGVVIVDEEHDAAYKSDRTPRYQARDVAETLGRLAGAPVVLGSATPDVATIGRARAGAIARFVLPERRSGRPPSVRVVDLRAELAAGNRGLLSRDVVAAIDALDVAAGDRAILVINRRGSASVVLCRDCGYVQVCPECHRPLVYHAAGVLLRCHHCGATAPLAHRCPACGSPRIRYLGGGTERLEREVAVRFPGLRVARLDRDVAARRGASVAILDAFRDGRLDVLVGTSLVAKGLDVPEVTLVAIVSADIAMNLPDVRAGERTYQLLVQALGRAGRGGRPGRAFIQTYRPDHPAVVAAATGDAGTFYDAELADRRLFRAPPFGRLVKLTVAEEDRSAAEAEARRFARVLRARAAEAEHPDAAGGAQPAPAAHGADVESPGGGRGKPKAGASTVDVLGPVPAYVARRGGRWRFHLVLRGDEPLALLGGDPGPPWSVDVDPESLL